MLRNPSIGLVVVLLVTALAGCGAQPPTVRFAEVRDNESITDETSDELDSVPPPLRPIITDNETVYSSLQYSTESGQTVSHNGTYYMTEKTRTGVQTVTRVTVTAESTSGPPDYSLNTLPRRDKVLFKRALQSGETPSKASIVYTSQQVNDSVIAASDSSVVIGTPTETFIFEINETETETRPRYRYTTRPIANSTDDYVAYLYQHKRVQLNFENNTAVNEAIRDEAYYGDTEEFTELNRSLPRERALRHDNYSGRWLVTYNGTTYYAELLFFD
jgi:hypothetical protein